MNVKKSKLFESRCNREEFFDFSEWNWFLAILSSAAAFFEYFFQLLEKSIWGLGQSPSRGISPAWAPRGIFAKMQPYTGETSDQACDTGSRW